MSEGIGVGRAPVRTLITLGLVAMIGVSVAGFATVSAVADDTPGEPIAFYGEAVDGDGMLASEGTELVAAVDGQVVDRITVDEAGIYASDGPTDEKLRTHTEAGDTVTFHVDSTDGPQAAETHTIDESGIFELDLTFPDGAFADPSDDDESTPSPSPSPSPDPDPEAEPNTTVVSFDDGVVVSVTDAVAGEPVSIQLNETVATYAALTWLNVTPTDDVDFNATIEVDDTAPEDVDELPDDPAVLLAVDVEQTLEADDIETAVFTFEVSAEELDALGVDPEDVTLYHYDDEWIERETTVELFPGDHMNFDEIESVEDLFPGDHLEEAGVDDPDALFPEDVLEQAESFEELFPGDHMDIDEIESAEDLFPGDHMEEAGVDDPDALFPGDTLEEAASFEELFPGDHMEQATFVAETPHFSAFVLAADRPHLTITEYSLSSSEVPVDEELRVDATVKNGGGAAGELELTLEIDGALKESKTVSVDPGETLDVTFTYAFEEPGEFDVGVGDLETATVTVTAASDGDPVDDADEDNGRADADDDSDESTGTDDSGGPDGEDDGVPGFGVGIALVALVSAALLVSRRQSSSRSGPIESTSRNATTTRPSSDRRRPRGATTLLRDGVNGA